MLRARRQTPKAQACQLFANSSLMHGDAEALFDLAFRSCMVTPKRSCNGGPNRRQSAQPHRGRDPPEPFPPTPPSVPRSMRRQRTKLACGLVFARNPYTTGVDSRTRPNHFRGSNSSFCAALSRQGGSGGRRVEQARWEVTATRSALLLNGGLAAIAASRVCARSMPQFSAAVLRSTPSQNQGAIAPRVPREAHPSRRFPMARAPPPRFLGERSPADDCLCAWLSNPYCPWNKSPPLP